MQNNGVGANSGVRSNNDRTEHLCACSNIYMAANFWNTATTSAAKRDLMKNQTIHPDFDVGMNNNSVGMGDQQTSANLTGERNFCTCNYAPKAMSKGN